ncbi:cytochrome b [Streptomyces aidingensis]|uniref:Cytochrome bc1 complex cytochrome b subunit n=1 Tax=Streptomyces aidingensis TaxID=910347 RepID=A0A1I1M215_9ACTN|nr:ubiquinol-cytochrome c reductase cytochrome b subunit [Streptomyces aidingensis]SFC79557.1 ubiquinol-cytochrome c reductase cytochrome b subunit [Streptomyces aidingensis]
MPEHITAEPSRSARPARGQAREDPGGRVLTAVDRRLGIARAAGEGLRKVFPDHWSFLLGEIALYCFVVLLLSGTFLALFFEPSMAREPYDGSYVPLQGRLTSRAYASTVNLSFDIRGGLLVRQIHHWAALVFVAAIVCHLLRIFFTGAFRRPREGNWTVGVTLLLIAIAEGFCGYSLPDDLLSGTGLRTTQGILQSIPVAGTWLTFLVFGGEFPGHQIIPRLYLAHVLLLPGLLTALLTVHILLIVRLKHTHWARPGRTNRNVVGKPMFPAYAAKSTGLFMLVAGVLTLMAATMQINPVWLLGPYRPDHVSTDVQPDWYLGFVEGALRLMPGAETVVLGHTVIWDVLLPGAVLPLLLFLGMYGYPFLERRLTGDDREHHLCDRPRNHPVRTGFGAAVITFAAVLQLGGGQDVIAFVLRLELPALTWVLRISLVVLPVLVFLVVRRLCLALQARDRRRILYGDPTGDVRRTAGGGYQEAMARMSNAEHYLVVTRDLPEPVPAAPPGAGRPRRRDRLRAALSSWFVRDRIELPASEAERRRIAARLTGPGGARPRNRNRNRNRKEENDR